MQKAHVISHSHWDREWYLPYEKHHMLFVEFMDTLIETLEKDEAFQSFHLDGQTILLEDYLEVRPERAPQLKALIEAKRLHVGPWYVLQDEFLTSSEANVRNLQYGMALARAFGGGCQIGYFPDSFGNIGQAPQILAKAGISAAVFGRGVKSTGFNNQVGDLGLYESPYSEMYWQSEDGSRVLGILFANWYNNGNEIPVEPEAAKAYWRQKLAAVEKYASTPHLLFMNGCDHQPVQRDLSAALKTATDLYPNMTFVHSNFETYVEQLQESLPRDMVTVRGELRSQQTNGWYTLANTASARIHLKQMNCRCQMLLEKVAEPLATLAYRQGKPYPHHLFTYVWKLLMENHPHDSICGCSVDLVHREMVTRFEKAEAAIQHIIEESLSYLTGQVDTSDFTLIHKEAKPFLVANTTAYSRTSVVELEVDVERCYFSEGSVPDIVAAMHKKRLPAYEVVNHLGEVVPARVTPLPNAFGYDLPKDKFRQPYIAKRVKVVLEAQDVPCFGWKSYALVPGKRASKVAEGLVQENWQIETDYFKAAFREDGSLELYDKNSRRHWKNLGIFEDCGDIGNEYIYFQPLGERPITTKGVPAKIKVLENTPYRAVIQVSHTMKIPAKADKRLDQEIRDLVEFKERRAQRVKQRINQTIIASYIFEKSQPLVQLKVSFNNQALDHRLRVLWETGLETDYHYADSVFEVAKRANMPSEVWENPCNAQHQQAFVNLHQADYGLTIANKGLAEYEVLRDGKNTLAITLHRGVRELGDWGVFLTQEAQCLGEHEVELAIIPHGDEADRLRSYQLAYQYQVDWVACGMKIQTGLLEPSAEFFPTRCEGIAHSALKVSERSGDIISRWYNLTAEERRLVLADGIEACELDLLEQEKLRAVGNVCLLGKKAICTLGLKG